MHKHGDVGTSIQICREMHTEVAGGMNTHSRGKNKESEVDAVMSSETRKNKSREMSASQTRKGRSKTKEVPKPNKNPEEAERDTTKHRGNTNKYPMLNEIPIESKRDTELDTSQQKNAGGGDDSGAHQFAIPQNISNNFVKLVPQEDQCATNNAHSNKEGIANDVNEKAATQEDEGATKTGGLRSTSDSTSLVTINCARPYTYTTPKSISVASTNINLCKGNHQSGAGKQHILKL